MWGRLPISAPLVSSTSEFGFGDRDTVNVLSPTAHFLLPSLSFVLAASLVLRSGGVSSSSLRFFVEFVARVFAPLDWFSGVSSLCFPAGRSAEGMVVSASVLPISHSETAVSDIPTFRSKLSLPPPPVRWRKCSKVFGSFLFLFIAASTVPPSAERPEGVWPDGMWPAEEGAGRASSCSSCSGRRSGTAAGPCGSVS